MLTESQTSGSIRDTYDRQGMIERALRIADLNILRIILYQLTGEEQFASMRTEKVAIRGGAKFIDVLAEEYRDVVRERAAEVLRDGPIRLSPPSDAEALRLMGMLTGETVTGAAAAFALEELAFAEFPREVKLARENLTASQPGFHVVIIGAGIAGIVTGIMLDRVGIPYRIYERQNDLGGTWNLNTYPEARVDVSSFLYQFRFEKNYKWPEYYATQQETQKYLRHIAEKFDVTRHIIFGAEVIASRWDQTRGLWRIDVRRDGDLVADEANVVVSASGLFSVPKVPQIPGLDSFAGQTFHTTSWDHSVDLGGKRVGIIGNGSTGVQLMPRLAREAGNLVVFQRTPQWLSLIEGYRKMVEPELHWLFDNVDQYSNWFVFLEYMATRHIEAAQVIDPQWQAKGGLINERNDLIRKSLTEYISTKLASRPDLLAKCLPEYAPLARRLVVDNGWYDALLQDNVALETSSITQIMPEGILTADGTLHELDVLVFATGFEVSRYFSPIDYVGRDGVTTSEMWSNDGARAYLGLVMPNMPNMFCLYGPNGQTRTGGSYYSWAENWARYVVKCICALVDSGEQSMEVRRDVFDRYNTEMDRAMKEILWESEASEGYFVNEFGRSGVNMPWGYLTYYEWVREPDLSEFHFRSSGNGS